MKNKEKRMSLLRAGIVILVLGLLMVSAVLFKTYYDNKNLDWVKFNGRKYLKSGLQIDKDKLSSTQFDLFSQSHPTGVRTKGMEVYRVGDNPNAPTVIYLKSSEGEFFTYELSGGP